MYPIVSHQVVALAVLKQLVHRLMWCIAHMNDLSFEEFDGQTSMMLLLIFDIEMKRVHMMCIMLVGGV